MDGQPLVELALISFATLLVLLSSVGTGTQASDLPGIPSALRQQLLRVSGAERSPSQAFSRPAPERHATTKRGARRPLHPAEVCAKRAGSRKAPGAAYDLRVAAAFCRHTLQLSGPAPSSAFARHSRKLYRTRFGFADGAYRALGPPTGDLA